jgi:glycogen debranching enzyme
MTGPDRRHAASRPIPDLDSLLSPAGWPYASAEPGRFHAFFGRDAAIVSLQVLPARPKIARATLRALASLQGKIDDPETDEEPGKIVHEWWPDAPERLRRAGWPVRDGTLRYYGSADSTCWFLVLLASLGDRSLTAELEPVWRAAGSWLEQALDRGGGLVRHGPRRAPGGLAQQGWRDSEDPTDPVHHGAGIAMPDGQMPEPPMADADSQAIAVVALHALAVLTNETRWRDAAKMLTEAIGEAFDPETLAVAGNGAKVPGAGSQLGWLLWADALRPAARAAAVERLCQPDVLTPWGLRTLSADHPQYAADAYHRGAVWPFDSWLGWGGLRAAGQLQTAERLRCGILAAIETVGDAPELFAVGHDGPRPVEIANRIQTWTVGARWALEHEWDGRASMKFEYSDDR